VGDVNACVIAPTGGSGIAEVERAGDGDGGGDADGVGDADGTGDPGPPTPPG
jgi:hypothetical protein